MRATQGWAFLPVKSKFFLSDHNVLQWSPIRPLQLPCKGDLYSLYRWGN